MQLAIYNSSLVIHFENGNRLLQNTTQFQNIQNDFTHKILDDGVKKLGS